MGFWASREKCNKWLFSRPAKKRQITTGTNFVKAHRLRGENGMDETDGTKRPNEMKRTKYATLTIKWLESHKVIYLAHKLW